jgi:hypothetical protein
VRLTLEEALHRVGRHAPPSQRKLLRERALKAAVALDLARKRHDESRRIRANAVEAQALARSEADHFQSLGQEKLFEAQRLGSLDSIREHERSLARLLRVARTREIRILLPAIDGPEARRRLRELTPEQVLALPRVLRQFLDDLQKDIKDKAVVSRLRTVADWNQWLIDLYESDYQDWAESYNLLLERQLATRAMQAAYHQQLLIRRGEYIRGSGTMDLWLESQRFYDAASQQVSELQNEQWLRLLRRQAWLQR